MSLTGTRIALVAAPAFVAGVMAGGGAMYGRQAAFETAEDWVISFAGGEAGCPAPAATTITVKRVAATVAATAPRGTSVKGFVEHGLMLRADLTLSETPVMMLTGTLGAPAGTNSWSSAGGARPCRGTWTAIRKTSTSS